MARRGLMWALLFFVAGCRPPPPAVRAAAPPVAPLQNPFPPAPVDAVDGAALDALLKRARESNSDALVVLRDGKLVGEWYFDKPRGPIAAMSVTKSIVSLAIGKLIDAGRLKSLDEPLSSYYPEWRQGRKRGITVRHILNHTSGLQAERTTTNEVDPAPDLVQLALAAELSSDPGTQFFYNNKAVNLLSGLVEKVSGKRLDQFVDEELFAPLGVGDHRWWLDGAGRAAVSAGLSIHALDLAKVGQMLLDGGTWQGRQIVSREWIAQSMQPSQPLMPSCGLLWWLDYPGFELTIDERCIAAWRQAKVPENFIEKAAPMKGRRYERKAFFAELENRFGGKAGLEAWYDNTWRRGLPDGTLVPRGALQAFRADGWLGQALVVVPGSRVLAVRQMRAPPPEQLDEATIDSMKDFASLVLGLVPQ